MAYLIAHISNLLIGIESYAACYKSEKGELVYIYDGDKIEVSEADKILFQKNRTGLKSFCWSNHINLKLNLSLEKIGQLELGDENNLNSIWIPLPSFFDQSNDIIAISFNKYFGLKNMQKDFSALSTGEKNILSSIIVQVLIHEYNRIKNERIEYLKMQNIYSQGQKQIAQIQDDIVFIKNRYINAYKALVNKIKYDLELHLNRKIEFTDNFILMLSSIEIHFDEFENVMTAIIDTAFNMQFQKSTIVIDEGYIEAVKTKVSKQHITNNQATEDKVYNLLNRYEDAAERIVQAGLPVNGKNIAAYLIPSITPAAVSDALKKNKSRIKTHLNNEAHQWPLLRENLKPIQQIVDQLKQSSLYNKKIS